MNIYNSRASVWTHRQTPNKRYRKRIISPRDSWTKHLDNRPYIEDRDGRLLYMPRMEKPIHAVLLAIKLETRHLFVDDVAIHESRMG